MIVRGSATAAVIGGERIVDTSVVTYADTSSRRVLCARCKRNAAAEDLDADRWCPTCVGRFPKPSPTDRAVPALVKPKPKPKPRPLPQWRPKPPKAPKPVKPPKPRGRPFDVEAAADLYKDHSLQEIAAQLQVSALRLRRALAAAGVDIRPMGRRVEYSPTRSSKPFDKEAAVAAYVAGAGLSAIALEYGVGKTKIRDAVIAAGIDIRPSGGSKPHSRKDPAA